MPWQKARCGGPIHWLSFSVNGKTWNGNYCSWCGAKSNHGGVCQQLDPEAGTEWVDNGWSDGFSRSDPDTWDALDHIRMSYGR